ncbi:hypothetical protein TCDM_11695 [Trypanosoma cruzi Dm28c]|uniref:Uncharacterized protein n=1 Tax=Trypanosoma cruzi Dm28c TaxID=1416333 RepID=V5AZQ7_TRYCR|nr:hypothetical protein TCDM_11695 [Trypanosoma cruzi Dm28c]
MRGTSTPTHWVAALCRECWVRMDPTCLTDAIKLRLRCLCVQYCPLLPLQLRMEKIHLLNHRTIRIQVRLPTLVVLVLVALEVLVLLLVPGLLLLLVVEAAELLLEVKVPVAFLLILLFLLLVLLALLVVLVPLLLLLPLLLLILQLAEVMVRRGPQAVIHLTQQGTLKQEFRRLQRQRLTTPRHPKDRQERHPAPDTQEKKKKRKIMKSSSKVMKHKSNNINSMNTPRKMAKNPRKIKTPFVQMPPQIQATVTAAPRSPTPPPLLCLLLLFLRVRLLLRWWPRESECERAVHRPHTHSSFSLSVCPLAWTLALTSPTRHTQ